MSQPAFTGREERHYIKISAGEKERFFGPFPSSRAALKKAVEIRRVFKKRGLNHTVQPVVARRKGADLVDCSDTQEGSNVGRDQSC